MRYQTLTGPLTTICCVAALLLVLAIQAPAQGCSMCRETAGFQRDRAITALQRGILTLAIPPVAIGLGLAWLTWKRTRRFSTD